MTIHIINNIEAEFLKYFEYVYNNKIISNSILYLNDIERFNNEDVYTSLIKPYMFYNGYIPGIHIFSFALNPLSYQPSGNANLSLFKTDMHISLYNNINPSEYNINIISRVYNILRFISGLAGLAWQ